MNILLTGADGQVGTELRPLLAARGRLTAIDRADLDLGDADAVRAAVRALRPALIVNAAAYTAVDRAEAEPDLAAAVNATAPAVLAEEAARLGARMVHYSTDYVYDGQGTRPYVETDIPAPLGVYGKTKLAGDEAVLASGAHALILRTSWVYGPHGHNFLRTMLRLMAEKPVLRVVEDQVGTPTSSRLIAEVTDRLLDASGYEPGVYHLVATGQTSWHGFATAILDRAREQPDRFALVTERIEPILTDAYPTPAQRPAYSVLCTDRIADLLGAPLPGWETGLDAVFAQLTASPRG